MNMQLSEWRNLAQALAAFAVLSGGTYAVLSWLISGWQLKRDRQANKFLRAKDRICRVCEELIEDTASREVHEGCSELLVYDRKLHKLVVREQERQEHPSKYEETVTSITCLNRIKSQNIETKCSDCRWAKRHSPAKSIIEAKKPDCFVLEATCVKSGLIKPRKGEQEKNETPTK